ncbi:hypothetical protein EVAR_77353_1 [Eumeta japonica]|uniref:Uncharacterized protein n=1 Tax=Eumeta variegata TaxID=151549 RepID=A0A4C1UX75_EUMVA|nr:hypothetical protein EVAR_77353_1 [Eumeta japonica]
MRYWDQDRDRSRVLDRRKDRIYSFERSSVRSLKEEVGASVCEKQAGRRMHRPRTARGLVQRNTESAQRVGTMRALHNAAERVADGVSRPAQAGLARPIPTTVGRFACGRR